MPQRAPTRALALVSALLAVFAACGDGDRDEEPRAPAPAAPRPVASAPSAPEPPVFEHEVGEGETLWDIARAYEVSVDDIMEANALRPRDVRRISKGRRLRIPGASGARDVRALIAARNEVTDLPPLEDGAYHHLADGETLWDVARLYDKSLDEIVERNQLDDDAVRALRPGRPIIVPGIRPSQVRTRTEPARRDGIVHELVRGETVWDLASTFQVSVAEIMAANGLSADRVTTLRDGTRLFLPGVHEDRATGRVRRQETPRQRRATGAALRLGLGTVQAAGKLLVGRLDPRWVRAAGGGRARLPGTLRWPVANGWFVRGFGSGEGGYHLAMDIMGEIGWNVRAAAPGIVAYSGNEVRGYGNLVIVVHEGGWVTMYAHNSTNFVVAGERVPRGGILAEVGSTGISRGPHVHFELIFDGRNCDPAPLFRPGVRHRNGRHSTAFELVAWTLPHTRPRAVQCLPRRRHPRSRWVIDEDPIADAEQHGAHQ